MHIREFNHPEQAVILSLIDLPYLGYRERLRTTTTTTNYTSKKAEWTVLEPRRCLTTALRGKTNPIVQDGQTIPCYQCQPQVASDDKTEINAEFIGDKDNRPTGPRRYTCFIANFINPQLHDSRIRYEKGEDISRAASVGSPASARKASRAKKPVTEDPDSFEGGQDGTRWIISVRRF